MRGDERAPAVVMVPMLSDARSDLPALGQALPDGAAHQIFERLHEGVVVVDLDLRCTMVNAAFEHATGLNAAQLLGRRLVDVLPAARYPAVEARFRRALAGEVAEYVDAGDPRPGDGRPAWIGRTVGPLVDRVGTVCGAFAVVRDVSARVEAEHARIASEERLALALASAHAGVWDWDLESGLVVWSREHEALWGLAPGSFGGSYAEFAAAVQPEDLPVVEAQIAAALASGHYQAEFRITVNGRERWIAGAGHTVSRDGRAVRMIGTVVDVTERKRAELALQCQARVLERVADGAPLHEVLVELTSGLDALTDGMRCSVLLLDEAGGHVRHVAAPGLPAAYVAAIDGQAIGPEAGACGAAAYLGQPVYTDDIATDPRWVPYRDLALAHGLRACWSTPLRDRDQRVRGTFAMYYRAPRQPEPWHLHLISVATRTAEVALEHERARAALAASEARYHDLYEHAPDMFLSVDVHTRSIVEHNRSLSRVTGYSRAELLGRDVLTLYDPAQVDRARSLYADLQRAGEVRDVELRIRCRDGRTVPVMLNASAVRDADGRIAYSRSVWRDITSQKRAEDELRRLSAEVLRSQDDERRRIARDLHDATGQNLAALAMNLTVVQRRLQAAGVPEIESLVAECAALTERSLGELRTLSYLLHPPSLEDFGLARALHALASGFGRRSGIEVAVEIDGPTPRVAADIELALFRVAQEALANVATHSGSPTATLSLALAFGRLVLEVRDVGRGPRRDSREGVGIASMRERLRPFGGTLAVELGATGGCVRATVPVEEDR